MIPNSAIYQKEKKKKEIQGFESMGKNTKEKYEKRGKGGWFA